MTNSYGDRPLAAIVTGSDSGIGRAVAVALAGDGAAVGVTYHSDKTGARETAAEAEALGAATAVRHLDLTDLPAAGDVIDELADELGGVDILVNCSGTGSRELAMDITFDRSEEHTSELQSHSFISYAVFCL